MQAGCVLEQSRAAWLKVREQKPQVTGDEMGRFGSCGALEAFLSPSTLLELNPSEVVLHQGHTPSVTSFHPHSCGKKMKV